MTADKTRLKASFMQWDIPPKEQAYLSPVYRDGDAARMDYRHIVATALGNAAVKLFNGVQFSYYTHDQPDVCKLFPKTDGMSETVTIDRKILIKILEGMDSDYVRMKVTTNCPLKLMGEIGGMEAGALIAPGIDCEGEE